MAQTDGASAQAAPEGKKAKGEVKVGLKRWMLNNEERLHSLQVPGKFEKVSKTTTPGPILRLIPGWSLIDDALWLQVKENPQVQILLENEIPHLNAPEHKKECSGKPYLVEGPTASARAPFADLDESQCRAMIRECFDEPLMKIILADEKRQPVVQALREKIDTLTKTTRTKVRA